MLERHIMDKINHHDSKQLEILFLDELSSSYEVNLKKILSLCISGGIDVYAIIKSDGTGVISGRPLDDPYSKRRGTFSCTYQLSKMDLLSIRADKEMKTDVSFRYDSGLDPDEGSTKSYKLYDFEADIGGWDVFLGDAEIDINSLFVYNDGKLDSIFNTNQATHTGFVDLSQVPEELQLAISVYYEFWHDKPEDMNPATKDDIKSFIERGGKHLSQQSIDRIETIAKPESARKGGARKTGRKTYKGKSQKK
jgi:hypothetical protein